MSEDYRRGIMNMINIGAYICDLRKQRDLTQVELADMLNVSHQAVSKWERGESLPDIMTLPKLSQILGKSVDDILSGDKDSTDKKNHESALIMELVKDNPEKVADLINQDKIDIESVVNVAPIIKPSMMNRVAEKLNGITIKHLVDLAPFLGSDTLYKLTDCFLDGSLDIEHVVDLAPFLCRDNIDKLIAQIGEGKISPDNMVDLAPFMSEDTIDRLVGSALEGTFDIKQIVDLAPFVGIENLDKLVAGIESGKISEDLLEDLSLFISKETLDRLVDQAINESGTISMHSIVNLAPFLSKEGIEKLLKSVESGKLNGEILSDLAPFISKDTLSMLVDEIIANNGAQS
jgi:transcriptional regulator with XRE-family HTH domain